ncbi:MAG TPA: lysylphosphatidylglycerol synthase transmembrane domain-containing protein, partial [Gemmatimonadaceae bacterium]|nr:lysylphosphatidylglycerol synthase transmembrane domain-containing protein [Gemmatimonadaceae bacterium]
MTASTRRLLRWGATVVAVVLLALAARTVDWEESWTAIRGASPALLLAAALVNLTSLATRAVRWWIFLRRAGAPSLGAALRAAVVASGLNNVLPASGGEAARVFLVARHAGISTATVLAALALDRLVEVISSVAMMATAPFFVPLPWALARWRSHAAVALVVLLVLAALLALHAVRTAQ